MYRNRRKKRFNIDNFKTKIINTMLHKVIPMRQNTTRVTFTRLRDAMGVIDKCSATETAKQQKRNNSIKTTTNDSLKKYTHVTAICAVSSSGIVKSGNISIADHVRASIALCSPSPPRMRLPSASFSSSWLLSLLSISSSSTAKDWRSETTSDAQLAIQKKKPHGDENKNRLKQKASKITGQCNSALTHGAACCCRRGQRLFFFLKKQTKTKTKQKSFNWRLRQSIVATHFKSLIAQSSLNKSTQLRACTEKLNDNCIKNSTKRRIALVRRLQRIVVGRAHAAQMQRAAPAHDTEIEAIRRVGRDTIDE